MFIKGAPRSLVNLDGGSPLREKVSHQPVTESHIAYGNKCNEAGRMELSDRNASEGIEPRNFIYYDGRLSLYAGMQQPKIYHGKNNRSSSGSKSTV